MMMDDVTAHRQTVLEIISEGQHIPREVYELRYSLFYRAAFHYYTQSTAREVLEPFPTCFYDFTTKKRRYHDLKLCMGSITKVGSLSAINDTTPLPDEAWTLLCWIFTNPLKIEVIVQSETSEYLCDVLREETQLANIPNPTSACNRFDITHEGPNQRKKFRDNKAKFGTFFAYHGSPGYNFHSIIHRGLLCSLNVRGAYGNGTYLTSYLDTASTYAKQYESGGDSHIKYCVAIVEVIKHPSVTVVNHSRPRQPSKSNDECKFEDTSSEEHRYYVVKSDELMRLRHLLVFYHKKFN